MMISILLIFSLIIVGSCRIQGTLAIHSSCIDNEVLRFERASYGPELITTTAALLVPEKQDEYLCSFSPNVLEYSKFNADGKKKAILAKRGVCPFVNKTRNAQLLGFDLLVVTDNLQVLISMTADQDTSDINIPSIMISPGPLAEKLQRENNSSCFLQPILIRIIRRNQLSRKEWNETLPFVYFNIAQKKEFSYLQQFYYHPYFASISPHLTLRHLILYTRECPYDCQASECIFLARSKESQVSLCSNATQFHSGRQILTQQIRSWVIENELGSTFWWKYVVLFYDNGCTNKIYLNSCVQKTLLQLGASVQQILQIEKRTKAIIQSTILNFLKQNDNFHAVKLDQIQHKNQTYSSRMHQTLAKICQQNSQAASPEFSLICKKVLNEDITIAMKDFKEYEEVFILPGNIQGSTKQIVRIQVFKQLMQKLDKVLIVLSRCPGVIEPEPGQGIICEPYPYSAFLSKLNLVGRYGSWKQSDMIDRNIEIFSTDQSANVRLINLSKREIINQTLTLLLQMGQAFKTFLKIIPVSSQSLSLSAPTNLLYYLTQPEVIIPVSFPYINDYSFDYYQLMVEYNPEHSVDIALYYDKDKRSSFYQRTLTGLSGKTGIRISWNDQYKRRYYAAICSQPKDSLSRDCKLFLSIKQYQKRNQFYRISFYRHQKRTIYPIYLSRPDQTIWNEIEMTDKYIQRVSMSNVGANNFQAGLQTVMNVEMGSGFKAVDLVFKTCKNNYGCFISSYEEWDQLENNNQTVQLYSQLHSTKLGLTSYYKYASYSQNHNVSELALNQPQNSISQFLKSRIVNVYMVYNRKYIADKVYKFSSKILLTRKHWEFSQLYTYRVTSISQSHQFEIAQYGSSYFGTIFFIQKNIDQNIRIMTRIITRKGNELYFQHFRNRSNNRLNSIFRQYQQLTLAGSTEILRIAVLVEDTLKRKPDPLRPYYSIGWYIGSSKLITLQENGSTYIFAFLKTVPSPFYQISSKNTILLHFSPQIQDFKTKVEVCLINQTCFSHSDMHRWKNLEDNQIVTGMKVSQAMKSGFSLIVTDLNFNQNVKPDDLRHYQSFPVEVRLETKVMKSMILLQQAQDLQKHIDKYQSIFLQPQHIKQIQQNLNTTVHQNSTSTESDEGSSQIENASNKSKQSIQNKESESYKDVSEANTTQIKWDNSQKIGNKRNSSQSKQSQQNNKLTSNTNNSTQTININNKTQRSNKQQENDIQQQKKKEEQLQLKLQQKKREQEKLKLQQKHKEKEEPIAAQKQKPKEQPKSTEQVKIQSNNDSKKQKQQTEKSKQIKESQSKDLQKVVQSKDDVEKNNGDADDIKSSITVAEIKGDVSDDGNSGNSQREGHNIQEITNESKQSQNKAVISKQSYAMQHKQSSKSSSVSTASSENKADSDYSDVFSDIKIIIVLIFLILFAVLLLILVILTKILKLLQKPTLTTTSQLQISQSVQSGNE